MHAYKLRPRVRGENHVKKGKKNSLKSRNVECAMCESFTKACSGKLTTEINKKDRNINDNKNNTLKHGYSLRQKTTNLQSIDDVKSSMVDKKRTSESTKKKSPVDPFPYVYKLRSKQIKSSSILNYDKNSSFSLRSHSIKCSTHKSITDNQAEYNKNNTLEQRYSLRCTLKSTNKEDYVYTLRSEKVVSKKAHKSITDHQREYNKNNTLKHGYSLRPNLQSIDAVKSEMVDKNHTSKSTKKKSPVDPFPYVYKLRSKPIKSSSILNYGKTSSYSLRSHSIKCSTHKSITDNQGEYNKNNTLKQRYSLRRTLKCTNKEDYEYSFRSKEVKRYSLRPNLQSIDAVKSEMVDKNHTSKSTKKKSPVDPFPYVYKLRSKPIKSSSILNYGKTSSYSLRSHSIKCSTHKSITDNQGEYNKNNTLKQRYSLRRTLKSTNKEDYEYSFRSKEVKSSEKLVSKNITKNSRKALGKLRIRGNSLPKSNTRTRDGCDIGKKLKLRCHKSQKTRRMKLGDIKEPQKLIPEENDISKSRNTPKLQEALEDFENESLNGLKSFRKVPKHKTINNRKVTYQRINSFERYGVLSPSYENVVDNINKIKIEANALDAYEQEYGNLDNSLPLALKTVSNVEAHEEQSLKDCKHLDVEQLQEYFQQNLDHTTSIIDGNSTSRRHERFKNYDPTTHLTMADLTYSPSIVVFTSNQRDILLKLLEDRYDPEGEKTEYLFKVLLPELCSKIFMDVHGMTEDDALDYLNWRPLD